MPRAGCLRRLHIRPRGRRDRRGRRRDKLLLAVPSLHNIALAVDREDYRWGLRFLPYHLGVFEAYRPLTAPGILALVLLLGGASLRQALNVSDTRVLFESGEPLPVENIVELTFHLPEQLGNLLAGQITCLRKAVCRRAKSDMVPPRSAVRFLELKSGTES